MKKTFEKSGKIAEFGLNFGFKLAILFGLGLTFESCQTDAHLHNYYQIGEKRCFMLQMPDQQELITISFDEQGFAGEGQGYVPTAAQKYKILLKGDCQGLDCTMTMEKTELKSGAQPLRSVEKWLFKDKNQLENSHNEQQLIYRLVNCPQASRQDTNLYDFMSYFSAGHAVVSRKGRYGIVDSLLNPTVGCIYPSIGDIHEGTAVFMGENDAYVGILDIKAQIIAPAMYEQASNFANNRAAVIPQGTNKWGFINRKNELVIAAQYDQIYLYEGLPEVRPFRENLAPVAIDNLWGFIDTNGRTVIPFQYQQADGFKNGKARVFYQKKWQYIDTKGEIVESD